jgi:hypothetical protein
MALRWEKQDGAAWHAYSGDVLVGMAVWCTPLALWRYSVEGIYVKWIAKGSGDVKRLPSARKAVERAWRTWLDRAGLLEAEA